MAEFRKTRHTLTIRLTPEDDEAVRRGAERAEVGPSTFARRAVLKAAGRPPRKSLRKPSHDVQDVARWMGHVDRLSGIANRLAVRVQPGDAGCDNLAALMKEVAAARASLAWATSR